MMVRNLAMGLWQEPSEAQCKKLIELVSHDTVDDADVPACCLAGLVTCSSVGLRQFGQTLLETLIDEKEWSRVVDRALYECQELWTTKSFFKNKHLPHMLQWSMAQLVLCPLAKSWQSVCRLVIAFINEPTISSHKLPAALTLQHVLSQEGAKHSIAHWRLAPALCHAVVSQVVYEDDPFDQHIVPLSVQMVHLVHAVQQGGIDERSGLVSIWGSSDESNNQIVAQLMDTLIKHVGRSSLTQQHRQLCLEAQCDIIKQCAFPDMLSPLLGNILSGVIPIMHWAHQDAAQLLDVIIQRMSPSVLELNVWAIFVTIVALAKGGGGDLEQARKVCLSLKQHVSLKHWTQVTAALNDAAVVDSNKIVQQLLL